MAARVLRCGFVGRSALLTRCAHIAEACGHNIRILISPDERVRAFARTRGIPYAYDTVESGCSLRLRELDCLFSIINGELLSPAVLSLPRRCLNFHNGPLPAYAGVHVTSWAILNGETTHGACWHELEERIDAGAVVDETTFEIPPGASAWQLNQRCHEICEQRFPRLLDALARDALQPRPQQLEHRRYYSGKRRGSGAGLVSWTWSAERIDRVVRAHTLGSSPNALGVPCCILGDEPFVITDLAVEAESTSEAAGSILDMDVEAIRIATGTRTVWLRAGRTLDGHEVAPSTLARSRRLRTGDVLWCARERELQSFERLVDRMRGAEQFWLRRWQEAAALERRASDEAWSSSSYRELRAPPALHTDLRRASPNAEAPLLLAALAMGIARVRGPGKLALLVPSARDASKPFGAFEANHVPLLLDLDPDAGLDDVLEHVRRELTCLREHAPCAADLQLRYPSRRLTPQYRVHVELAASVLRAQVSGQLAADTLSLLEREALSRPFATEDVCD